MKLLHLTTLLLLTCAASYAAAPLEKFKPPMAAPTPFDLVEVPSRSVLTGNAAEGELALDSGASYVADPPFTNPADPDNRRLIDGDRPVADWNTTAGINAPQQTVTFDLKSGFALDEVALHFDNERKPASVQVALADAAAGPWREVGTLNLENQQEAWWRLPLKNAAARFVRLNFTLKDWGWYLREVKVYGTSAVKIGAPLRRNDSLVLADQSGPRAAIVVADRTRLNALEAAQTFQKLTRQMTGVLAPILPESKYDGKSTAIFIGDSKAARARGVTIEQTPFGDDRYVMRTGANWLALIGNDVRPNREYVRGMRPFRGSEYAVYDFFERLGCGWYGPNALWQVVPSASSIAAPKLNVTEIPAFKTRDLWMFPLDAQEMRSAWRLGGFFVRFGHTYNDLVPPAKYKAEHPEWFGEGQPDLTNPEVIRIATQTVIADLDARPDEPFVTFPVGANDTGGFVEKPFNPAIGNNAAQQLYFASEIAKGVRAARPNRQFRLGTYGYWFSHDGPEPTLKGAPEAVVFLVNEGDHTKPLEFPESAEFAKNSARNNTLELAALANWKKTGNLQGIYEWWIPVLANPMWKDAPWYDGDTTVRNLRLWRREGIKRVSYEIQGEKDAGFPLRWAQYYVAARALWNPQVDPHEVLLGACRKLFGAAANTVTEFYEMQQSAMRATKEHGGNWSLPSPHLIYPPALEARGDALLQRAAGQLTKLPTTDAKRQRLEIETAQWQLLKKINAEARAAATQVFKVTLDGKTMEVKQPKIEGAAIRDLFGIPTNVALEAREFDGQTRALLPGESYDLKAGVTFQTAPKK